MAKYQRFKPLEALTAACIVLWLYTGIIFGCALVSDDYKLYGTYAKLDVVSRYLPGPFFGALAAFFLALFCNQHEFIFWHRARLGLTYFFCVDFSVRLLPVLTSGLGAEAHPLLSVPARLVSRGLVSPSSYDFHVNTIGFGVVAIASFLFRLYNKVFFLKDFVLEDYIMSCVVIPVYLTEMTLINVSANYATNLYPPEQEAAILADPKDVADRIYGSKLVIGLEQSMLIVTWGIKVCLWIFFWRLTTNVDSHRRMLKYLAFYIVGSFIIIDVLYYGILCRPFREYYAMPVKNLQCATYQIYSAIQMFFNITSDLCLYGIPLNMLRICRISTGRISLFICFSLGAVTILFAILNKAYNFGSPMTTTYALWYIRETSMGILVCNVIASWKLIQKCTSLANVSMFFRGIEIHHERNIAASLNPVSPPVQQFFRKRVHDPLSLLLTTVTGRDPRTHTDTVSSGNELGGAKSELQDSSASKDSPVSTQATPAIAQQGSRSSGSDIAKGAVTVDNLSVSQASISKDAPGLGSVAGEERESSLTTDLKLEKSD